MADDRLDPKQIMEKLRRLLDEMPPGWNMKVSLCCRSEEDAGVVITFSLAAEPGSGAVAIYSDDDDEE